MQYYRRWTRDDEGWRKLSKVSISLVSALGSDWDSPAFVSQKFFRYRAGQSWELQPNIELFNYVEGDQFKIVIPRSQL